jgi:hypothetical protein
MAEYTLQNFSAELNEFLESILSKTADAQLIELNKWLPERLAKLPESISAPETSKNITSISSRFPVQWKDKAVYPYVKPKMPIKEYADYMSTLNSNKKDLPLTNLQEVKEATDVPSNYLTMVGMDFLIICTNKNQHTHDEFGLKMSELCKIAYHDGIRQKLIDIMNKVLVQEEDFCEEFRSFWIKPTFKGGDANDTKRFRPLICMPILVRILDSFLSKKTHELVLQQGLINTKIQKAALRETSGIFENLFEVNFKMNRLKEVTSNNFALFLDLANAFGSVNYKLMLHILEIAKYPKVLIQYFTKYYKGAIGHCKDNTQSTPIYHKFIWKNGILQGSALSNILFLIYIDFTIKNIIQDLKAMNMLPQTWSADTNINGFVDDFVFFFDDMTKEKQKETFELMKMIFSMYGFQVNSDKTFFYAGNEHKKELQFGEQVLSRLPSDFKYLGLPLVVFKDTSEWVVENYQKCLFQIDSFDIEKISKITIYKQTMIKRINRIIEAMVYNQDMWKAYEKILFIERYFLMRWGVLTSVLPDISMYRKMKLIVKLVRKLEKMPQCSVDEFIDKSTLMSKYGMSNDTANKTKSHLQYGDAIPHPPLSEDAYKQKYEKLEEELAALKASNKFKPFDFNKLKTSFYVDNFVEHIQ